MMKCAEINVKPVDPAYDIRLYNGYGIQLLQATAKKSYRVDKEKSDSALSGLEEIMQHHFAGRCPTLLIIRLSALNRMPFFDLHINLFFATGLFCLINN